MKNTPKSYKIVPRAKQVLVKPEDEKSRESKYGIITPTTVEQEKKAYGTVQAVGNDIKDIKEGDRVIFGAYVGERISIQENEKEVEYLLLFDEDVLAFLK